MKEIEALRGHLYQMIASDVANYDEILRVSQELDLLIVQYIKENRPL